jgi:hypothetical protein
MPKKSRAKSGSTSVSDVMRTNDKLYIWKHSHFCKPLKTILKKKNIKLIPVPGLIPNLELDLNGDACWLRDYFLPLKIGKKQIGYSVSNTLSDKAYMKYCEDRQTNTIPELAGDLQGASMNLLQYFDNHMIAKQHKLLYHDVFLEGGNIITLDNGVVLIGNDSLLITQYQLKYANDNITSYICDTITNYSYYYRQIALEKIQKVLGSNLVWLQQPSFHLDICIAAGPNNIVFIHDPNEILKINDLPNEIYDNAKEEIRYLSPILDKICDKLRTAKLVPIRVPGRASIHRKYVICFMNAIMGVDQYNQFYYITGKSKYDSIQRAFRRILKQNGVSNVHFIGNPDDVEKELLLDGSLRCQTVKAL